MSDTAGRKTAEGLLPLIIGTMLAAAALAFTPALFNDGDTGWHLATGRFIIDTGSVPHGDPFSFTFRGQPWTAHEWLADVAMAALFQAGGWAPVALLFAAALAAILFLVGRELLRILPLRYVLVALTGLAVVLAPATLARPHVLAWLVLTVWLLVLLGAREQRRAPPLLAAALMLLWANLHASYLIGLGLAGVFALEALVEERDPRRTLPGWILFGLVSLVAAFATPHGVQGFLYPFQVSGMKILPLIDEWRPTRLPEDAGFAIVATAVGIAAVLRWRRVGWVRLVLLGGLAAMAIAHSRHQPLFAIVGMLAIVPRALGPLRQRLVLGRIELSALMVGAAMLCALRLSVPLERGDTMTYPPSAIASVPDELRASPVLNSYSFGGPLILHGIAPFIDGRADMYGDDFTILHSQLTDGDMTKFRAAADRWNLRWTILTPGAPLVARLDAAPGWRRHYADASAVIHVRTQ